MIVRVSTTLSGAIRVERSVRAFELRKRCPACNFPNLDLRLRKTMPWLACVLAVSPNLGG